MRKRKVNNYIEDATDTGTGNDKFNSTTLQKWTVPAGKRWTVLGGLVNRDAASTCAVVMLDTASKVVRYFHYMASGTGQSAWPNPSDDTYTDLGPIVLDAGEMIQLSFGAAQGAGAYASCVVLEESA